MIPVDQTRFGNPLGNCLMACVASILERSLEELPDLQEWLDADEEHWFHTFERLMESIGWLVYYEPALRGREGAFTRVRPRGYHIGSGLSPRDLQHAVVVLDGEMVHDPHPSRAGVASIDHYYILVPLAPLD